MWRFCGAMAIFVVLLSANIANAEWADNFSKDLMSPFCPGRTLPDCPSPQAYELRVWIRQQEAAGRSLDAVKAELIAEFGVPILGRPPARGFGLAAYLIPAVVFLVGAALVVVFFRRQHHRQLPSKEKAESTESQSDQSELEAWLDRELEE